MKALMLISSLLIASNVHAVSVKNCPQEVTVKYSNLQIKQPLNYVFKEGLVEEEETKAVTEAYNGLSQTKQVVLTLPRAKAANGRCSYSVKGNRTDRITLYTSKGKDLLMAESLIGDRGILGRVYAKIALTADSEIALENANAGFAMAIPRYPYKSYSAGGALVFIGNVNDLTVDAK